MDEQVWEDQGEVSVNLPCAQAGEVQPVQALLHLVQVGLSPQAGEHQEAQQDEEDEAQQGEKADEDDGPELKPRSFGLRFIYLEWRVTFHHQTLLLQLMAGAQPGEALGQEFQLLKHLLLL